MADILDSVNQNNSNPPPVIPLADAGNTPVEPPPELPKEESGPSVVGLPESPPSPPPEPPKPAPIKKKHGKGLVAAVLLLLLLTIPVAMYYLTQQGSLADLRGRAAYANCGAADHGGYACASLTQCVRCDNGSYTNVARTFCAGKPCDPNNGITPGPTRPPGSTTITPTLPPGGQCGPVNKPCDSDEACGNAACRAANWVCVGSAGQRTCQQGPPNQCPESTCSRINAYHCNQLTNGECHQNLRVNVSDWEAGRSHAAGCGQVDRVCAGGPRENLGCGSHEIFQNACGGGPNPTNPPGPTTPPTNPTPTTPPAGPQCSRLRIYKDGVQVTDYATLRAGDQVVIAIVGTNANKARIRVNGGAFTETNTKNAQNEYTMDWPVPANTQSFVIEGEVFGNGQWQ